MIRQIDTDNDLYWSSPFIVIEFRKSRPWEVSYGCYGSSLVDPANNNMETLDWYVCLQPHEIQQLENVTKIIIVMSTELYQIHITLWLLNGTLVRLVRQHTCMLKIHTQMRKQNWSLTRKDFSSLFRILASVRGMCSWPVLEVCVPGLC